MWEGGGGGSYTTQRSTRMYSTKVAVHVAAMPAYSTAMAMYTARRAFTKKSWREELAIAGPPPSLLPPSPPPPLLPPPVAAVTASTDPTSMHSCAAATVASTAATAVASDTRRASSRLLPRHAMSSMTEKHMEATPVGKGPVSAAVMGRSRHR